LGNWLAQKLGVDFLHLLLVRNSQKKDGEAFAKYIIEDSTRTFQVITWNLFYDFFNSEMQEHPIATYLDQKTLGYRKIGSKYHLQRLLTS